MASKEALKDVFDILINFERIFEAHDMQDIKKQKFEIIEKDLDVLERYKTIEKELGIDFITLFKAFNGLYYRFRPEDRKIYKMKVPMLRIINGEYCWICPKWMTTTWMSVRVKDYGKMWALDKEEFYKNIK